MWNNKRTLSVRRVVFIPLENYLLERGKLFRGGCLCHRPLPKI